MLTKWLPSPPPDLAKNLSLLLLSLVLSFFLIEVTLYFYNPFGIRVRGEEIILPKNQSYMIQNHEIDQLPDRIHHTKNSLGFRGPEPPEDFRKPLTMITVGGSTTECFYLPDGEDWPALLKRDLSRYFRNLWVNNAGLDGHSSYGHLHLLEQYLVDLNPDVIVFFVGHNDMGLDAPKIYDRQIKDSLQLNLNRPKELVRSLVKKSEVLSLLLTAYKHYAYNTQGMQHGSLDLDQAEKLEPNQFSSEKLLKKHREQFLPNYRERIRKLIGISQKHGIYPVFFTQPVLYGEGKDPVTGVNLERLEVGGIPGRHRWKILELYNKTTLEVAEKLGAGRVDMAHRMPKNSHYYYDRLHFTIKGARKFSEQASGPLCRLLRDKFPDYIEKECRSSSRSQQESPPRRWDVQGE